jgi:hypothetical protein
MPWKERHVIDERLRFVDCLLEGEQQARSDDCVACYNTDRPHQALGMKGPADSCPGSTCSHRRPAEPLPLDERRTPIEARRC